jgi:hypothetical protein
MVIGCIRDYVKLVGGTFQTGACTQIYKRRRRPYLRVRGFSCERVECCEVRMALAFLIAMGLTILFVVSWTINCSMNFLRRTATYQTILFLYWM